MLLALLTDTAGAGTGTGTGTGTGLFGGTGSWTSILLLVAMFVAFYFLLIRPQRKKEKAAQEMRNSLDVGDSVTSIGGIIGRVVSIKDDSVLIETGSDKTKLRIKKWAVQDVEKLVIDQ